MGLARKISIRRGSEIKRVMAEGQRLAQDSLRLHLLALPDGGRSRAAVVVPKFGRTAVLRNRLKRRLQELVRTSTPLARGWEVVVRVKPWAYELDFAGLRERFSRLEGRVPPRAPEAGGGEDRK